MTDGTPSQKIIEDEKAKHGDQGDYGENYVYRCKCGVRVGVAAVALAVLAERAGLT